NSGGLEDDERPERPDGAQHTFHERPHEPDPAAPRERREEDRREIVEEARAEDAAAPPLGVRRVDDKGRDPDERQPAQTRRDLAWPAPRAKKRSEREDDVRRVDEETAGRREQEAVQRLLRRRVGGLDAVALVARRAEGGGVVR